MTSFPFSRLNRYLFYETIPYILLTLLILTALILTQQVTRQSDLFFNSWASMLLSMHLILYLLPGILVITLPFSLLIGSLMALNRVSSDNEIIAARASGITLFHISRPFTLCGIIGAILCANFTLYLIPKLVTSAKARRAELTLALLAAPIKPQTFNTQFPSHLIFIRDVDAASGDWLGVFIIREINPGHTIILTASRGRLRLTQSSPLALEIELSDGLLLTSSLEEPQKQTLTNFQQQKIKLSSQNPNISQAIEASVNSQELSLPQLTARTQSAATKQEQRQATVEWHKRFSLPTACLVFIILAIPLGLSTSRQAGRTVALAIGFTISLLYYLVFVAGQNLALSGILIPWQGVWLPNLLGVLFALLRYALWPQNKRSSWYSLLNNTINNSLLNRLSFKLFSFGFRRPVFSSLINYLLVSELLKYFSLSLLILLFTSLVFTLFDILPSLNRSGLGWQYASTYLLFLAPQIGYYVTPFALLLAVLTAHGVLSRSNQITALLTTGQGIIRLSTPILLCTVVLILGMFWLSEAFLPLANREQDARYNRIKGKKAEQSIQALGRYWNQGEDDCIYGFQINNTTNTLINTSVYKTDKGSGRLVSLLQVQEAQLVSSQKWQIKSGWFYLISPHNQLAYSVLPMPKADHPENFLKITEGISIFRRIVNESAKMSFHDLRIYIGHLRRFGIPTAALQVDLEKKLAFPFSCLCLLILACPLAFKGSGHRRGKLAGVGLSIIIGLTFWITTGLLEGLGKQAYLPPGLSVWGSQGLFLTLGVFFIFRQHK